jgi:hypothetical protein
MKCDDALDTMYGAEDILPLGKRIALAFHIILCGHCAARLETYEEARSLLQNSFFPPSPDFSNAIMDIVYRESQDEDETVFETGGFSIRQFSLRGWVIAGIVMLFSLATVFFGKDFTSIALEQGSSFLLPLGIITGIVITGYGALFIGSHLKELSERFSRWIY